MDAETNSFLDQISRRTICLLSEREEFDEKDLELLKQLLHSDRASNSENVVSALRACEENFS